MPTALIPVLASVGITGFAATAISAAVYVAATYFVSDLLRGGSPKPDAAERSTRTSKPPRVHVLGERRVYPAQMLFTNNGDSMAIDVFAFCEGPIQAVLQVYLNDDRITISGGVVQALPDGSYGRNAVLAGYNLGPYPAAAHAAVVSRVPAWTNNHRGDGIVSGYLIKTGVKSEDFLDIYPQGDNVEMSLAVRGHFCHDPRNPASDPYNAATWPYTENAALHLLWFKTVFKGEDYATKIAPVEQYWINAANVCDEAIPLAGGGSEPRYRSCVMFAADANPADIEAQILAAFDGWTGEDENGCIKVYAGKLYEPTLSIGPSQIIDYGLQEFVEDENRLNEIIVRHVSAEHDYNEVEPEAWRDDSDITARGKIVNSTLDLQVPSHTQSRRIAKRTMARTNAPQRGTARVVFSAREVLAERYINLTLEEAGTTFFSGRVEVLGGERDHETGGAVIEWVAVDPNLDAWNPATEDGQPAPTAAKYYLPPLSAPTIDIAEANFDAGYARISIQGEGPAREDLTWYARTRLQGETAWLEAVYSDTASGTPVALITGPVASSANVEVAIAYSVSDGRISAWSATETVDTTPP